MKITETMLRKLIRKAILKEFVTSGTGTGGRKLHKGRQSKTYKNVKSALTVAEKAKKTASTEKDKAKSTADEIRISGEDDRRQGN